MLARWPALCDARGLTLVAQGEDLRAFGAVAGRLALGYGLELLLRSDWLKSKTMYYWGDIDTHGFAMLDRLRGAFPEARSFLMDRATLLAHRALWGQEGEDGERFAKQLTRLNDEERAFRLTPAVPWLPGSWSRS